MLRFGSRSGRSAANASRRPSWEPGVARKNACNPNHPVFDSLLGGLVSRFRCKLMQLTSPWVGILFFPRNTMSAAFYHLLKAPSVQGRRIMDEIEGFREYLKVAEEEQLNLENPPERTPQLFEKFYPTHSRSVSSSSGRRSLPQSSKPPATTRTGMREREPGLVVGNFANSLSGSLSSAISSSSTAPGSSSGSGGEILRRWWWWRGRRRLVIGTQTFLLPGTAGGLLLRRAP